MIRNRLALLLFASSLLLPSAASAVDIGDGKLTLRGNGSWSWQKTTNDAQYLRGDKDGDWDTAHFDLALIARPADELSLNFQVSFNPMPKGSEANETTNAGLDWAFLDWRLSDALHLRAVPAQLR